ncbi:MAG: ABC transporter permease [Candidatus Binatia bacterium]
MGWRDRFHLLWAFTWRQIIERYRGSALGIAWAFINPLVALGLWTFLFTTVLRLRYERAGGTMGYAIMLWAGMVPWMAFSEAINGAMNVIRGHSNLVKRTVFPIEVLPLACVLSGFVQSLFALAILVPVLLVLFHGIPWVVVFLPLVILLQLAFTTAIAYPVAILTTLLRDAGPVVANLLTTAMYLTPVIYPIEGIPEPYRTAMLANPLAVVIQGYRHLLLDGVQPPWPLVLGHLVVWAALLLVGLGAFRRQQTVFAEVL